MDQIRQGPALQVWMVLGACLTVGWLAYGTVAHGLIQDAIGLWFDRQARNVYVPAALLGLGVLLSLSLPRAGVSLPLLVGAALSLAFGWAAVLAVALVLIAAFALGSRLRGRPGPDGLEDGMLSLLVGAAALAGLAQLLVALPGNREIVRLFLLVLSILAGREAVRSAAAQWMVWAAGPGTRGWKPRLAVGLIAASLVPPLCYASLPESLADALTTHFALVEHVDMQGRWHFDPVLDAFALMPKAAVWLFTWAHLLAGERAAHLLNVAMLAALALFLFARLRPALGGMGAALAITGLVTTPLTIFVAAGLYEDIVTACFALAAVAALERALVHRSSAELLAVGLSLGAAVAAKYHGLFLGTLGVLAVAVALARPMADAGRGRALAALLGGFAVIGPVPYAVAFALTGNPVFPYMNEVFGSHLLPDISLADPRWLDPVGLDYLHRLTFATDDFLEGGPGAFGLFVPFLVPLVLAALPAMNRRELVLLGIIAVFVAAVTIQLRYLRYLFYVIPLLMLLLPAVARALGPAAGRFAAPVLALVVAPSLVLQSTVPLPFFSPAVWVDPVAWDEAKVHERRLIETINAGFSDDATVYFADRTWGAGLSGRSLAQNLALRHAVRNAASVEDVERLLRAEAVTHVVAGPGPVQPPVLETYLRSRALLVPTTASGRLYALPPVYALGEVLRFSQDGRGRLFQSSGWSPAEIWGTWSQEPTAGLRLALSRVPASGLELTLVGLAHVGGDRVRQTITVLAGGEEVARWTYPDQWGGDGAVRARIPADRVGSDGVLTLEFVIADPRSPADLGIAGDTRALGLGLRRLRLDPAGPD